MGGQPAVRSDVAHGAANSGGELHGADGDNTALDCQDHIRVQERDGDDGLGKAFKQPYQGSKSRGEG